MLGTTLGWWPARADPDSDSDSDSGPDSGPDADPDSDAGPDPDSGKVGAESSWRRAVLPCSQTNRRHVSREQLIGEQR